MGTGRYNHQDHGLRDNGRAKYKIPGSRTIVTRGFCDKKVESI